MREIRPSGSEGGVALTTPFLPLSNKQTWRDDLRVVRIRDSKIFAARDDSNGLYYGGTKGKTV